MYQHADGKGNVALKKIFNASRQGHGHNRNNNIEVKALVSWICGEENLRRDCPQHHDGRPNINSAQEVQSFGDVGQSIPRIYETMDNRQAEHQASIIEMDSKLCDQVISILIYLGSNYRYVSPNLVDMCGLNKELHSESWLVQLAIDTKK